MEELMDIEQLKKLTPAQQEQVIAGVKQQAAIANAQNLITVCLLAFWLPNDVMIMVKCRISRKSALRSALLLPEHLSPTLSDSAYSDAWTGLVYSTELP